MVGRSGMLHDRNGHDENPQPFRPWLPHGSPVGPRWGKVCRFPAVQTHTNPPKKRWFGGTQMAKFRSWLSMPWLPHGWPLGPGYGRVSSCIKPRTAWRCSCAPKRSFWAPKAQNMSLGGGTSPPKWSIRPATVISAHYIARKFG